MFRRRRRPNAPAATNADVASAVEIADDIRATIARLDAERTAAARMAGRALVDQAEVRRACDEQLRMLAAAAREAERGEVLASRAAARARADADDADCDVESYDRAAAGLHTVRDALDLAAEPLETLLAEAHDNAERARAVMARAQQVFDEQVRAQVRLLVALERAERSRAARRYRR